MTRKHSNHGKNAIFITAICLLAATPNAHAATHLCGFECSKNTTFTSQNTLIPSNAWVTFLNILTNLDQILYSSGSALALNSSLDVPMHPFEVQSNEDAAAFVTKHNTYGTPGDLDTQDVYNAIDAAQDILDLFATYPTLLTTQNQSNLTNTCNTIISDLSS